MSTSRVLTSRRTTISLVLGTPLALAACELDPPAAPVPAAGSPDPEPAPDTEVAAAARKSILLMVASLEAATVTHPRLGPGLRPWLALHAAHLEVLEDGSAEDDVDVAPVVDNLPVVRRRLLAEEAALATRLADGARQAASGALARALASMSAAVRQRLVP